MTTPRFCFIVLVDQCNSQGYIPSVVYEDEDGHSPLIGSGEHSQPWFWGRPGFSEEGWEQAQRICAEENARLGLTPENVAEITASSIRRSLAASAAKDRLEQVMRR